MKILKLRTLLPAVAILSVLSACRKDKTNPTPIPTAERAGIYVLSQGSFNGNNSALTYYSFATQTTTPDIFKAVNTAGIGDTGNDVKVYGSKMYIVVNVSSTIEVVNAKTAKSIKQIRMFDGTTARQPRFVAFYNNKAFISSFDGTVAVMDTASLAIEKYITVGRNPEQMVISNGKLYVANSGGLDFGNPDVTVSVIDLNTLTETKKITVPSNPIEINADAYGDVYVVSYGTDFPAKPYLTIINNTTDAVKSSTRIDAAYATPFVINGDNAYYITDANKIKVYNVKTEAIVSESFVTDATDIKVPFGITVDDTTGEVFITDAVDYTNNGLLYAFDKLGKKQYSFTVGINPGAIVLVNK